MGTTEAGEGNVRLEHEHEVVELGAPFAQVFGPEIVDSNLKDFEFRLMVYLRITAARNSSCWVSYRQMAKHLGRSERSVKRAYAALIEGGFAKSKRRGMGQTTKKYLAAPSAIYGSDRMRHFFGFLRSDTSDKDIAHLRRVDNSDKSSSDKIVTTEESDLDNSDKSSSDKIVPQEGTDVSPKKGQKCVPHEVDLREVDQKDIDQDVGGAPHHSPSDRLTEILIQENTDQDSGSSKKTQGDQLRDFFEVREHVVDLDNLSDDERQAASQAAVAAKEDEVPEAVQRRMERIRERKTERMANTAQAGEGTSAKTRERYKGKDRDNTGRTTKDLEGFYRQALEDYIPDARFEEWKSKELKLAMPLIGDFGWNLTTKVIIEVCKNWPAYRERMKIRSLYPGINWIYACRSQLFGEMQLKIKEASAQKKKTGRRLKMGERYGE